MPATTSSQRAIGETSRCGGMLVTGADTPSHWLTLKTV
jgi:hypothetical protein